MWKIRKNRYSSNGRFFDVLWKYSRKGKISSRRIYGLPARFGVYVYKRKNGRQFYSLKLRRLKDRGF